MCCGSDKHYTFESESSGVLDSSSWLNRNTPKKRPTDAFDYSVFPLFLLREITSQEVTMLVLGPVPLVCHGLRVFAEMLIVAQMK